MSHMKTYFQLINHLNESKFMRMPSGKTYLHIGHDDGQKVIFWVWYGGKVHTSPGDAEQLHDDHFPAHYFEAFMTICGRVVPNKNIGSINHFSRNPRTTEQIKKQLARAFPKVTFFVSTVYDEADLQPA